MDFKIVMMKKIFKTLPLAIVTTAMVLMSACERESLDEVLSKEQYPGVGVSLAAKTEIGTGSTFTLTGSELTVPVTIQFSAPTTRAFSMNLSATTENIEALIASNVLPAGTLPIALGSVVLPTVAEVPIGVSSFSFNVSVSRSFIENNYGKRIAVSIKVMGLNKENIIAEGKDMMAVLINTSQIIEEGDVHNIEFNTPSNIFTIPTAGAYVINSENITIKIPIRISGDLGAAFTVDAVASPDSVTKYIQNGYLTNSVLYASRKISIQNSKVRFDASTRTAYLEFTTKRDTLLAMQPAAGAPTVNKPVIAFTLKNPSKYQVGSAKSTLFVSLDANFFRPYNGSPFLVKGGIGQVSDAVNAAYYDFGGINVAWWDTGGKDGDSQWRLPDLVDVASEFTPRTSIGWTNANEYVTYSIYVEESGTYDADLYFGYPNDDGRYSAFIDNINVTGGTQPVQNTGGYHNQNPHKNTVQLTKGYHILKVFFANGGPDYRCTIFTRKS